MNTGQMICWMWALLLLAAVWILGMKISSVEARCAALENIVTSTPRAEEAMKSVSDLSDKTKSSEQQITDLQRELRELKYGGN